MTDEPADDLTDEERILFGNYTIAANLALGCRRLKEMRVATSDDALNLIVNYLMTEFWDQGFSQTEIRTAFTKVLADMNRYAAGEERRLWTAPSAD